jgi:hypothetical protein
MDIKTLKKLLQRVLKTINDDKHQFYTRESSIQFLLAKEIENLKKGKEAFKATIEKRAVSTKSNKSRKVDIIVLKNNDTLMAIEIKYYTHCRKMGNNQAFHTLKDIVKCEKLVNAKIKNFNLPIIKSFSIAVIEESPNTLSVERLSNDYKKIFVTDKQTVFKGESYKLTVKDKPEISLTPPNITINWQNHANFRYYIIQFPQ